MVTVPGCSSLVALGTLRMTQEVVQTGRRRDTSGDAMRPAQDQAKRPPGQARMGPFLPARSEETRKQARRTGVTMYNGQTARRRSRVESIWEISVQQKGGTDVFP